MTDEEIYILYRDSIDKTKQIKILADLNLCEQSEIHRALKRYKIHLDEIESYRKGWGKN